MTSDPRGTLAQGLTPAVSSLNRSRRRLALREGFSFGLALMPKTALGLALGFWAASYVQASEPFPAWLLPPMLSLVPFGAALAIWFLYLRQSASTYEAALASDEASRSQDRLSAAVEFSDHPADSANERFKAAAIEDGLSWLRSAEMKKLRERFGHRPSRTQDPLLGFFIAAIPFLLSLLATDPAALDPEGHTGGKKSIPRVATVPDRGIKANEHEQEKPSATTPEKEADRNEGDQTRRDPTESSAGKGSAQSGQQQAQGAEGSPHEARAGQASPGGQSGAGQGQAGAQASKPQDSQNPASKPRKPTAKPRPRPRTPGTQGAESGASPGGPSRGQGKMTAVGNRRPSLARGSDRDDDPDVEDEDIEDETEETEQRGGVMPSRRDRNQAAARELSISGTGPPNDGRGGPTPPKKSRGTASLVLGIRLPDHIRGQPNPGTAKTSLEQVPARPQPGNPYPVKSADIQQSPGKAQSPALPPDTFDETIRSYHKLLRQTGK